MSNEAHIPISKREFDFNVGLGFSTQSSWPENDHTFKWNGYDIKAKKKTDKNVASIFLKIKTTDETNQQDMDVAIVILRNVLSAITWETGIAFTEETCAGSSTELMLGLQEVQNITPINTMKLVIPKDKDHEICLALFREGTNATSPLYKFLCFFKIIEQKNQKKTESCINRMIISTHFLKEAANEIKNKYNISLDQVGNHIYTNGRCAIAHFSGQGHTISPDSAEDLRRISQEMYFVRQLAKRYIQINFEKK